MIHSSIIAMINYKLLRDLMIFVLLYLYVTINRIYGDLGRQSIEIRYMYLHRRSSHDSSRSLIIIHIHTLYHHTCTHRACAALSVAVGKTSKFRAASQVAVRIPSLWCAHRGVSSSITGRLCILLKEQHGSL